MIPSKMVLEPEIKTIVINHLLEKGVLRSNDLIINEFTVGDFSRRVDLALVHSDRLLAFEIKSEADSLARLNGQVNKYLEYFDKVIVVAASKHINKIMESTPCNVGVWELRKNTIIVKRKGRLIEQIQKDKLLEMMTVHELNKVARFMEDRPDSIKRKSLEAFLLKYVSKKSLKNEAIRAIKSRYKTRNERFFNKAVGTTLTPDDLKLLSFSESNNNTPDISSSISDFIEVLDSIHKKTCLNRYSEVVLDN